MAGPRGAHSGEGPGPAAAPARGRGRAPGPRGTPKDRALRLLATRWRSRSELAERLTRAGFDPEAVEAALADLEQVGLVDDARFAAEVARSSSAGRLEGDRALRSRMRRHGVAADVAEAAIARLDGEEQRASALAERRAARLAGCSPEVALRRLQDALLRRGFGPEIARRAARGALEGAADWDG